MSEAKSFRKQVLSLLGETYGERTLVLCPTVFVRLLGGDHKAAILLSQILYWSDKTKDSDGWFYKSYADWKTETGLSEAQVRRIVNGDPRVQGEQLSLRNIGVETLLKKVKHTGAPTLHYRVNQSIFLKHLHTTFAQGDTPQCAESTPSNVNDEAFAESGMNPAQSGASSDPEIPAQIPSEETSSGSCDDDLLILRTYEDRFGKLKDRMREPLRNELSRLSSERAEEVLKRCAVRGRSWNYVLKALANEDGAPEAVEAPRWGVSDALDGAAEQSHQDTAETALLPVSESLQTPWHMGGKQHGTVADAWEAARAQLQLQFGSEFHVWGRGLTLVDYNDGTFTVAARTAYARDLLEHRLNRSVARILSDVYGAPIALRYVCAETWMNSDEARTA